MQELFQADVVVVEGEHISEEGGGSAAEQQQRYPLVCRLEQEINGCSQHLESREEGGEIQGRGQGLRVKLGGDCYTHTQNYTVSESRGIS